MVTHIVIFFWTAGVTGEQVDGFRQALDQLASEVRALAVIRHGPDLRFRDGSGDYALVATFSDRASWDTYQSHPAHKAFVRDFVTPLQDRRVAIQF
jgi:quinol monooxygenase YgiN